MSRATVVKSNSLVQKIKEKISEAIKGAGYGDPQIVSFMRFGGADRNPGIDCVSETFSQIQPQSYISSFLEIPLIPDNRSYSPNWYQAAWLSCFDFIPYELPLGGRADLLVDYSSTAQSDPVDRPAADTLGKGVPRLTWPSKKNVQEQDKPALCCEETKKSSQGIAVQDLTGLLCEVTGSKGGVWAITRLPSGCVKLSLNDLFPDYEAPKEQGTASCKDAVPVFV